jgi:mannan endo-1,4-beta-mannosidase
VANTGTDWLVCHYKLLGYVQKVTPDLRAFGVQDDTLALLWIQNETTSQQAKRMQVQPQMVEHVALDIGGMKSGCYEVEVWDTNKGEFRVQYAAAEEGRLSIPLPPVATDIAIKLRRL